MFDRVKKFFSRDKKEVEFNIEDYNESKQNKPIDEDTSTGAFIAPKYQDGENECSGVEKQLQECIIKNKGFHKCGDLLEDYNTCYQNVMGRWVNEDAKKEEQEMRKQFEELGNKGKYVNWNARVGNKK